MKEMLIKYLPYTIIVILIILMVGQCARSTNELATERSHWKYKEMMYTNNRSTLSQSINKLGQEVTSQHALIVSKDEEKAMLLIENERLKNIKSEVKIITKTIIKEVYIPFETTIYDTIEKAYVKPFHVLDKWYGINGKVLENGIKFDSVYFNNKLTITIGDEKQGLFKKSITTVDIVNDNPYSSTKEAYNVVIEPKKKQFYQKPLFLIGVGVVGGFILTR